MRKCRAHKHHHYRGGKQSSKASGPKGEPVHTTLAAPFDQQQRNVGFLLESRAYADGLLVLRHGKVISERYWNGLVAQDQRLLLGGTRPLVSLMGAMAVAQGKLSPDRSIIRYIPALSGQTGLRKLSVRRLLEGEGGFDWSSQDVSDWLVAGGWNSGKMAGGIRAWLNQPGRWERDFSPTPQLGEAGPDTDLLVWALAEAYRVPLTRTFCHELFEKLRPESAALWLTTVWNACALAPARCRAARMHPLRTGMGTEVARR